MNDQLRAFRGFAIGSVIGIAMWVAIILAILLIVDAVSAQTRDQDSTKKQKEKCPPLMPNCRRLSEEEKRQITEEAEQRDSQSQKENSNGLLETLRIDGNPLAAFALVVFVAFAILAIVEFVKIKRGSREDPYYAEQRQIALDAIAELDRRDQEAKRQNYRPGSWR